MVLKFNIGYDPCYFKRPGRSRYLLSLMTVCSNAGSQTVEDPSLPAPLPEIPPAPSALTPIYPQQVNLIPLELTNESFQTPGEPLLPPALTPAPLPDEALTNPLVEVSNIKAEPALGSDSLTEITESPKEDHFHYHIRTKASFDNNLFLTEDNTLSDTLLRVSARATWESGRRGRSTHWLSAYAEPSYVKFLENDDLDNFDYRLGSLYEFERGDTTINATLTYDSNSDVDRFTSQRFEQNRTSLIARGNHRWSGKTILDAELLVSHTTNDQFSDVTSYGGRVSTLYHVTDKTNIGPFLGIKRSESDENPSFYSLRTGAHLKYDFTDKINLEAFGGIEYRDFESGRPASLDPSFSFRAKFEKSDKLSHELTLAHRSYASFNINSAGYRATTLDYRAVFKPSSKIRINGNLGYEYDDYFNTGLQDADLPTIKYFYAGLGLAYDWTNQHSASLGYRYRASDSTEPNRDFSSHLLEFNLGYKF